MADSVSTRDEQNPMNPSQRQEPTVADLKTQLLKALTEHDAALIPAVQSLLDRQDAGYPITRDSYADLERSRGILYDSRQEERHKITRILDWLDECVKSGAIDEDVATEARIIAGKTPRSTTPATTGATS